jgi:hypothetical protein
VEVFCPVIFSRATAETLATRTAITAIRHFHVFVTTAKGSSVLSAAIVTRALVAMHTAVEIVPKRSSANFADLVPFVDSQAWSLEGRQKSFLQPGIALIVRQEPVLNVAMQSGAAVPGTKKSNFLIPEIGSRVTTLE